MASKVKTIPLAAAFLVAGMGVAAADPMVTTTALNLRDGPGTGYAVITSMPEGAMVDVQECRGNWCALYWRGFRGYASASYLATPYYAERPRYAPPPRYGAYRPRYYGPRYYGPPYYYGGPGITLRFGF